MEKSPCKLNLLHCRQKTTTSLWKRNEKGIGKTRKMRPQANSAQYNTQGWDMRGGSEVRRQWEGRGWAAPLCQLIYEPGEMVWQYIYFSTLLKRDFYLQWFESEGQQKPGDVTLMQSDCKWLHEILLFRICAAAWWGRSTVATRCFNFRLILFRSHFSLLLNTRTFFAIRLAEKMHSLFSASHQSENPFPAFFFVTIFTLS